MKVSTQGPEEEGEQCQECGKTTKNMKRHQELHQQNRMQIPCPICGKVVLRDNLELPPCYEQFYVLVPCPQTGPCHHFSFFSSLLRHHPNRQIQSHLALKDQISSSSTKKRARMTEESVIDTPSPDLQAKKKQKASPPQMMDSSVGPSDKINVKEEPHDDDIANRQIQSHLALKDQISSSST
jgi:hypothetical protein